ncbi:hypothetical protein [uncultured Sulfitobacter sp.]|uniref:hypothetical protein n=1 Tax=uncultured Sulfitobacter sp. TaxID=191468 RepID=UPI0026207266|nr:hypothetical protein [uncultured Sulfitobacter sp.]
MLNQRVRTHLCEIAAKAVPVTYLELAKALDISPPNIIRQVTDALEILIEEDAAAGHPLMAALVISKGREGLPALGFFESANRVGRFYGEPSGPEAVAFYAAEFESAVEFWRT